VPYPLVPWGSKLTSPASSFPSVIVRTHRAVVSTDNVGHVPAVLVRLSNGRQLDVPVGLTGVEEEERSHARS
jgi:hypothetical protein